MSVRHIHMQAQAQAELERQRAAQKASDIQRKETMLNDPEYRNQVLESRKISRDKKRQAIEDDSIDADARNHADRMAKVRRVARDTQNAQDARDREELIEKVHQRYNSYNFSSLFNTS